MKDEHDTLFKAYFGNNGTRRVVVTHTKDGKPDWYELPGGPFDWGTLGQRSLRLAYAILRDLGASDASIMRYGQKLLLNLISNQPREERLAISESEVLVSMGCRAIDSLCEVE